MLAQNMCVVKWNWPVLFVWREIAADQTVDIHYIVNSDVQQTVSISGKH